MTGYRDLIAGFRQLQIGGKPLIVHASLTSLGDVRGGVETLLGALLSVTGQVMAPAFTYKTMLVPEVGPEDNGITYGSSTDLNKMTEFYRANMPVDKTIGILAETIRSHPKAQRSNHPILSFAGIGVEEILAAQSLSEPLAPIGRLVEAGGWVVLIGVDHTVNTSFHWAEREAGRKQFVRWALTKGGVAACPGFPGCSDGFEAAARPLAEITNETRIGQAILRALPLQPMTAILCGLIRQDPLALLCSRADCERCSAVRSAVASGDLHAPPLS